MAIDIQNRRQTIRSIIESSAGRFCRVTYIKMDGSERQATLQPAANKFHVKGAEASASAQKAVASRAANNPHLYNYFDVEKKAFRSLNLDRVTRIAVNGLEVELPDLGPVLVSG